MWKIKNLISWKERELNEFLKYTGVAEITEPDDKVCLFRFISNLISQVC